MSHPDPLIMLADIARVASERPERGEELVQALYLNLTMIEGRQPAIDELREYVDRLSSLDERTIRQRLGLGPKAAKRRRDRQTEQGTRVMTESQTAARSAGHHGAIRGPGRTELDSAERGQQIRERIGIEQARSKGGPPPGGGLTRDSISDAAIEHREPDGTWPTQTAVSLELGKDEGGRRIRHEVESDRLGYPTLEEIEAKRRELAATGRPHGFDALGGKSTDAPFPGQRSTIRRRYLAAGLPPPGSWIPGICDTAPRHPHPRPT